MSYSTTLVHKISQKSKINSIEFIGCPLRSVFIIVWRYSELDARVKKIVTLNLSVLEVNLQSSVQSFFDLATIKTNVLRKIQF